MRQRGQALESEAAIPNQIAKRQRELLASTPLPRRRCPPAALRCLCGNHWHCQQVAALKTNPLDVAQTRISALIDDCESSTRKICPD